MTNLDDFLSTQDEHFNKNAQSWYFEFTGNKKPNTEMPFKVFVNALHEVYFFIQQNLNKPFGCIEKINIVSEESGFSETEKLILIDKIIGILYHHPETAKQQIVFIQLVDFRNSLNPYTDDPEVQNPDWTFDIDAIKAELATIQTPTKQHKFLMNLLFEYSAKAYEIPELEHKFYESIGLVHWIKTQLTRCEYEQKLEAPSTSPKTKSVFKLNNTRGNRIDLIRILNALYELRFIEKQDGQIPTKQDFFNTMGEYLGADLSKYHSSLSQALQNQQLEVNLEVFDRMKSITTKAHYDSKE